MTDDRIRDGERRARRPGHRTRWPGHCAGTEATPQPRPPGTPSSSLSPAVPHPFCPPLSLSLFLSVILFHPRRGSLSLPRALLARSFSRAAMPWSANLENPPGACVSLFVSLPSCNVSTRLFRKVQMNSTLLKILSSVSFRRTATLPPPPPREFLFLCFTRFSYLRRLSPICSRFSRSSLSAYLAFRYFLSLSLYFFSCAQPSLPFVPSLFAFLVFPLPPFLKLCLVSSTAPPFSSLSVPLLRSPTQNTWSRSLIVGIHIAFQPSLLSPSFLHASFIPF